ncbi:putative zinc-binding protein [Dehalobacter sp. DCM]|nr:putative zinc-binding protein [Dehalobacter sp. DCM]
MNFMSEKVKVVPCSGIGKVHGLLARELALKVANELCAEITETPCLAYIVTEDPEIKEKIARGKCVTIDGCPKMCAAKSVAHAGGDIAEEIKIIEILKNYRGVQPGNATALNDDGWKIVDEAALKVAARVQQVYEGEV